MKKLLLIMLMVLGVVFAGAQKSEPKGKYAIVLQAGNETNEGMARAIHALLYARELAEGGYTVVLIFDGAGTGWANELRKPENPLHKHYVKIKELGMVEEICDYCAEQFGVKDQLTEQQRNLLVGDYDGHPSLVKWIEKGYQVVVL
ncbi:DsrE family protein [Pontiella sulfatireligans]|uniref:Uncharacterized protein n=1 Tax=Pontiella sulfatireligans TaxID=2750658 RepID=A0A6C2UNV8_9BACT|nr:DsrE family protein [Pontiella sulfatireligans]VGO21004.1 hypothetical protein SCARR_03073 [Pontiella sulfatireligans]